MAQLEPWPLGRIFRQERFRTKDPSALRLKKFPELGREERRTIRARIEIEQHAPVLGQKIRADIVDKKFPVCRRPFDAIANFSDAVKTNPMRSDEIERLMKIGQESLSFDSADHARNAKQLRRGAKKRFVVRVEAERVMAEQLADVKKIAGAAAKIENAQGRCAVEPKVLRALDIDVDPIHDVFETVDSR